jgi:hypothetical protein
VILPAVIVRIVGFLNKENNSISDTPQEGGLILCYSDAGKAMVLSLTSNKKDLSLEDIKKYFENKMKSTVKSDDIKKLTSDLMFDENFEILLEDELKKQNFNDNKEKIQFKKDFSLKRAKEIIQEKRTIKGGSIIKTVIDIPDKKMNYYQFKSQKIPLIRSRALIFDDAGKPTSTGLYYFSQLDNILPISIKPVFNRNQEPLGFFRLQLSALASLDHYIYLHNHIVSTITKNLDTKIYLTSVNYDYDVLKSKPTILNIIKTINNLAKNKDITKEQGLEYINQLNLLLEHIKANRKLILSIYLGLNLKMDVNNLRSIITSDTNPFMNLKNVVVNLGFSKEDPEIKNILKEYVSKKIDLMLSGVIDFELLTTYFIMPDTWGFMTNNIQVNNFILSARDTRILILELTRELNDLK